MGGGNDVCAIIDDSRAKNKEGRDIIITFKQEFDKNGRPKLERIHESHQSYLSLAYPVVYVTGEPASLYRQPHNHGGGTISMREQTRFQMFDRLVESAANLSKPNCSGEREWNFLHHVGRLYQKWLCDIEAAVEQNEMYYIRKPEVQKRIGSISDAKMAVSTGRRADFGMRLPKSFKGSPAQQYDQFQNAMQVCRSIGKPYLFITLTTNPNWPEWTLIPRIETESVPGYLKCTKGESYLKSKREFLVNTRQPYARLNFKNGVCRTPISWSYWTGRLRPRRRLNLTNTFLPELPEDREGTKKREIIKKNNIHKMCGPGNPGTTCFDKAKKNAVGFVTQKSLPPKQKHLRSDTPCTEEAKTILSS